MNKITLSGETRKVTGRKVKTLRKDGLLPANIYGKKVPSQSIQLKEDDFLKVYREAGETGLIELTVGKDQKPVLIHEVQLNPVTDTIIHVDFLAVDLKEKVQTTIPVEVEGESPAEKSGIGTVVQQLQEVEVEALPGNLVDRFVIDASKLTEVDQAVLVKDLGYDASKIEVKTDPEAIVVKVEPPQKEEVIAPPPAPEGEVPTEGGEAVEGQVPAEGGEQTPEGEAPKSE